MYTRDVTDTDKSMRAVTFRQSWPLIFLLMGLLLAGCALRPDLEFAVHVAINAQEQTTLSAEVENTGAVRLRAYEDFDGQLQVREATGRLLVCVPAPSLPGPLAAGERHFPTGWRGKLDAGAYQVIWGTPAYGSVVVDFILLEDTGKLRLDQSLLDYTYQDAFPYVEKCDIGPHVPANAQGQIIDTPDDLIAALREAGARVETRGKVSQPFFSVQGQEIAVNEQSVQIFAYPDQASRRAESEQIASDGTIKTMHIDFGEKQVNFWAKDRLIIFYLGQEVMLLDLFNTILGEALTADSKIPPPTVPEALTAARQRLSKRLGIPAKDIQTVSYEHVEWRDACLGLPTEDEACAQITTPGWRIMLKVGGQNYECHTDQRGTILRWKDIP